MMSSSSRHLASPSQTFVAGDVIVHPSVAIAPGVLLRADPGSQIVIEAGVCIGMGTIVHARQGTLEIGEGASLGAGTLLVGAGRIGSGACLGAATTLYNASVEPGAMISPGSLLGESGRQINQPGLAGQAPTAEIAGVYPSTASYSPETTSGAYATSATQTTHQASPTKSATYSPSGESAASTPISHSSDSALQKADPTLGPINVVYGQAYFNQLLVTMMPHRRAIDRDQGSTAPRSNDDD